MKKILLSTDFSENSIHAIHFAFKLFGLNEVSYILVNSFTEPRSTHVMTTMVDQLRKDSKSGLDKLSKKLLEQYGSALKLNVASKYGNVFASINKISREEEINFTVIGTRGTSTLENIIVGSNTLDILKYVKIPTLIVPESNPLDDVRDITFATDFEVLDRKDLIKPLEYLALKTETKVKVLNIQKDENSISKMDEFKSKGLLNGINHEYCSIHNSNITNGINEFLDKNKSELLVMIAKNHNFIEGLFHRSITKGVTKSLNLPLLVIHE